MDVRNDINQQRWSLEESNCRERTNHKKRIICASLLCNFMPIAAGPSCKQKQKTLINYAMLRYDLGEIVYYWKSALKL